VAVGRRQRRRAAPLTGHENSVDSVAFKPNGKRIVTASWDKTARLWDAGTVQELVERAKLVVPRCLTKQQRETFLGKPPPEPPDWCYRFNKWPYETNYWMQVTSREEADEVFRHAMADFGIAGVSVSAIYHAVRVAGERAWRANGEAKAKGEKRILKRLPDDPLTTWAEWKAKPDHFE
jgi:hypothetical protein